MFKHILFPTDGSVASEAAVKPCIQFASETGAKLTCLHVVLPFHMFSVVPEILEYTQERYKIDAEIRAKKILSSIELAAQISNISSESMVLTSDHPYEAIIQTAQDRQCDLITMASHGHKGVRGFLLGSETQKVLSHSKIPVLVFR